MVTPRKTRKKSTAKKPSARKARNDWHLKLAFTVGKAVKKVSHKIDKAKKSSRKRSSRKVSKKSTEIVPFKVFQDIPEGPMAPILKELKAIADVSGLTAAIEEMHEISLKHSSHPVVSRLTLRIQQLPPLEQEMLSRKLIERLRDALSANQMMFGFPGQGKMTEEDCEKMSGVFIECLTRTLEDAGMTTEEREFLLKFSDDVTRPLNKLVQFYLHPKTFSQKVKRLWRMQRIFIKLIKLVKMSNDLALENAKTGNSPFGASAGVTSNYWQADNTTPIFMRERDLIGK